MSLAIIVLSGLNYIWNILESCNFSWFAMVWHWFLAEFFRGRASRSTNTMVSEITSAQASKNVVPNESRHNLSLRLKFHLEQY